jgi:hypothetical protein
MSGCNGKAGYRVTNGKKAFCGATGVTALGARVGVAVGVLVASWTTVSIGDGVAVGVVVPSPA